MPVGFSEFRALSLKIAFINDLAFLVALSCEYIARMLSPLSKALTGNGRMSILLCIYFPGSHLRAEHEEKKRETKSHCSVKLHRCCGSCFLDLISLRVS